MKLYKYYVVFDDTISDIKISNVVNCEAEIYDKTFIKHDVSKGIETVYKVSHANYTKFLADVAINSVAFPMDEGVLTNGKPSYYCIFTDICDDEINLKLFKKLIFCNSFLGYENIYGAKLN